MCTVRHDGFEIHLNMIGITLKRTIHLCATCAEQVCYKGYCALPFNYIKNITVNDVVESLCAVFCACVEHVHNRATPP